MCVYKKNMYLKTWWIGPFNSRYSCTGAAVGSAGGEVMAYA